MMRLDHWLQDIKFGVRILTHAPGLSAAAILLIALVIGGNATVYSMVNSVLVSPPSGVTRGDLVVIRHVDPSARLSDPFVSFPNFEDYARHSTTITGLSGWNTLRLTLGTPTGNFAIFGGVVTANYFETFGVGVVRGRGLVASDDDARDSLAVVISHRLWQERFNLAEDIIGTPISINRASATIVGVAAPGFAGATLTPGDEAWLPIRAYHRVTNSEAKLTYRGEPAVLIAGRLNPAASLSEARAELATLFAQLQTSYPDTWATYSPEGAVTLRNARVVVKRYSATVLLPIGEMAPVFLAVFSVVTLLTLIIVCANVANLLLGRAVERQRDTAVRLSLGASRARIVRMLLAEGATLAILAWIAAYVMAWWTSQAMLRFVEPRPGLLANAKPDWTLAAYGLTMAFVATLVFSLAPAMRSWRVPVSPLLKAGGQGVAGGRSRWATALVVLQFAFSVLLVTAAGLAYRSITSLTSVELGFKPDNILLVTLRLGDKAGPEGFVLLDRIRERLITLPGVEAASYARRIPGATLMMSNRLQRDAQHATTGFVRQVGPDYLRVLGLRVIAGRELGAGERRGGTRVAMINQTLATDLFGNEPPIGHQLTIDDHEQAEVVGVVTDALFDGPNRDPRPRYLFLAEQQTPGAPPADPHFFIRHRGTLEAITPLVTRAIGEVDAGVPVVAMATMASRLALVFELDAMIVRMLVGFAAISLVIAAFGHYAVAMFNMRRRTREFGVRMALGASTGRIQAAIVRESVVHATVGVVIGLALSAALAVVFRSILFGVTPVDPITYAGVVVLLAITSIIASYVPALRASRVNVVEALRQE
ncbi:MAG: ADOP family duplicated permease [Cyanobacteria bacterium]|nr:ADOP family duplicated permease [Cyanobacteriota bacterium]